LPAGTKIIGSIWAMKKKSNGTLRGQMNTRGFKQVKGQHYNGTPISSPVTNSATIRIVLMLMIMASMLVYQRNILKDHRSGGPFDFEVHYAVPPG